MKEDKKEEKGHALYSPSSLELLELCPSFKQAERKNNSAAEDGTRLHKAVEIGDLALCENAEEEDAVKCCLDYKDQVVDELGEGCEVFQEMLLDIGGLTEGTGDLIVVSGAKAHLVDWKFGRVPVTDAENNIQMQAYAFGVFLRFPEVETVEVSIVCPRVDVLSTATYSKEDCSKIQERIEAIIRSCESPVLAETPAEKSCGYCGRKAECIALTEVALMVGRNLNLPTPVEFDPGRIVLPSDRAKAQVLSFILEDWAKKIRELNAKAVIEDGIVIPGFEIRSKRGTITVNDVHSAAKRILEAFDEMGVDDIHQACSLSIPKLTDIVYAKKLLTDEPEGKKVYREQIESLLEGLVSETETVTFLQRKRGMSNEDIIKEAGK